MASLGQLFVVRGCQYLCAALKMSCASCGIKRIVKTKQNGITFHRLCKMGVSIGDITLSSLQRSHVHIKNVGELEKKLEKMKVDGKDNLQVIADFDWTLTKQRVEKGDKMLSSFGMFRACPSVPEHYKLENEKLCKIYQPIEKDPSISFEEKSVSMMIWYRAANKLMKGFAFPGEELEEVVSKHVVKNLRDGVNDMFMKLYKGNIPVLVFSAGLGNAIECCLKCSNNLTDNVKIISNFANIDENGIIQGIKGDIIHVLNKNEAAIKGTEYYDMIKNRSNVLLLGDMIGDAKMADGMDHSEAVIKIGFLSHNLESDLPHYMEHFDIVLVDDQTVDIPSALLDLLIT